MKRITLLAAIVAMFAITAADAQVHVHVGFNYGTPYYPEHRVIVQQQPVYYPQPVYQEPVYQERVYQEPVYQERVYQQRVYRVYHQGYGYRPAYNSGYYRRDGDEGNNYYRNREHEHEDRGEHRGWRKHDDD